MSKSVVISGFFVFTMMFGAAGLYAQVNVTTWHNDNWRTGQNTGEMTLTTSSFNNNGFGLLCKIPLPSSPQQEEVYAQPLVVANGNGGMTVYVATMQDQVYVFNVPGAWTAQTCALLQQQAKAQVVNLLDNNHGLAGQFPADVCLTAGGGSDTTTCTRVVCPSVGILGTPVIDSTSNTLYLVTESQDLDTGKQGINCPSKKNIPNFYHYLHALDLTSSSLAEKNAGPVQINPGKLGSAVFESRQLLQRPGLLFIPPAPPPSLPIVESVYAAFSMMDGTRPNPSGWVLSWDGGNLGLGGLPVTFATVQSPDTRGRLGGGIWQGGAGLASGLDVNQNNYLYLSTADGQFGVSNSDYGDTFLKLDPVLGLSSYFTPADWDFRFTYSCNPKTDGNDMDLGSAGEMLVPDGVLHDSHYKNIVIKGDKEPNIWVIDRTNPGGTGTGCGSCQTSCGTNNVLQQFPITGTMARSTPAFWYDGTTPFMYITQQNTQLTQYKLNCTYPNGPICSPAVATTSIDPTGTAIGYATTPSVSSNGTTAGTGIVWAVKGPTGANLGLYAFNAENISTVLYQPSGCPNRDAIGPVRFSVPTIANGYVFVGTQTDFDIFGTNPGTCN